MARAKTLCLAAINISIEDHYDGVYKDLFGTIFNAKKEVKLRGQDHAKPNTYKIEDDLIVGSFFKYTDIDTTKPWLDKQVGEEIKDEEGHPVPQTQPHLAPNTTTVHFVFHLKYHRLFFFTEEISPTAMNSFLNRTFERLGFSSKISATIEQSMEGLEKILRMPFLRKLDIYVNIPNPDDSNGLDQEMEERLKEINASSYQEVYRSKKDNLKPDHQTKAMMRLATSNGSVFAIGIDENSEKVEVSTKDTPMLHKLKYDKNKNVLLDSLRQHSVVFLEQILNKIKE